MRMMLLCPLVIRSGMLQRLCNLRRFDRGRYIWAVSSLDSHDGRRHRWRRSRLKLHHHVYETGSSSFTGKIAGLDCVPRTNLSEA
jgi:hypothetical protein